MKRPVAIGSVVALAASLITAIVVTASTADAAPEPTAEQTAIARADAAIAAHGPDLAVSSDDAFSVFRTVLDPGGASHVRYTRTYKGLRVLGGDIVVHNKADGSFAGRSNGLAATLRLSTDAKVTKAAAAATARQAFTGTVDSVGTAELVVDAADGVGRLAYETVVKGVGADGQTPSRLHVLTDAQTGEVLGRRDEIHTVDGTGNSLYGGTVTISTTQVGPSNYKLTDPTHGNGITLDANNIFTGPDDPGDEMFDSDNVWGTGLNSSDQSAAVDAHYGAALTFDYFKNVHGRNGIFGDGLGVTSVVHFGDGYDNAFWDSGGFMVYGDNVGNARPLTSIDVAGHEMTHGITENLVPFGLLYESESGGLNEATSDIFGTMVEFAAANAADPADYLLGEEIDYFGTGDPLRIMYDPALDGFSHSCWSDSTDDVDVHFSSGVANHFYFMLAEGSGSTVFGTSPVCGALPAVTGIGRTKSAAIWYRALNVYFVSNTAYVNPGFPTNTARAHTLSAATDLYGSCSTEYLQVQAAWNAVNVAGVEPSCGGTPPPTASCSVANATDVSIFDNATASSQIIVTGCPGNGSAQAIVDVHLIHTFRGDLDVTLVAPDSTAYPLIDFAPSDPTDNFDGTFVVDLSSELANGTWTLQVHDDANLDTGYINSWAINLRGTPGSFVSLAPTRILDTRTGNGAPVGKVAPNGILELQVTGRGGVPSSDVAAVVLNVTATGQEASGFVTVFPTGASVPTASNLNFSASQTIANLVVVKLGTAGKVSLKNGSAGNSHLIADVAGYYLAGTPTEPGTFVSLDPSRILDTRTGNGAPVGKVAPNGILELQVTGRGGVPGLGVSAVVLNVTVTGTEASGFVTVFPTGASVPTASNLNFVAAKTVPNLVVVQLGTDGKVSLKNGSSGNSHLIADVAGYYLAGTATLPGTFVSLSPSRILDTRNGTGAPVGKVAPNGILNLQVTGAGGVPGSGVAAVVANVTVTGAEASGFITVYPTGGSVPTASNLNFVAGKTVPNLAMVKLGTAGQVSLKNGSSGNSHLIADVAGYFLS